MEDWVEIRGFGIANQEKRFAFVHPGYSASADLSAVKKMKNILLQLH